MNPNDSNDVTEPTDEQHGSDPIDYRTVDESAAPENNTIAMQRRKAGSIDGEAADESLSYKNAEVVTDAGRLGDEEYFQLELSIPQAESLYHMLERWLGQYQGELHRRYDSVPQAYLVYAYPAGLYDPEAPHESSFTRKLVEVCLTERQARQVEGEVQHGDREQPFDGTVSMLETEVETAPMNASPVNGGNSA